jgi:hypothetical protein
LILYKSQCFILNRNSSILKYFKCFSYYFSPTNKQLSDFTELRAPTPEKAALYFDAAVSSRTSPTAVVNDDGELAEDPDERRNSNMIFTLHVYQYMIDKVGTGESKF